jgi:hypothetical protein
MIGTMLCPWPCAIHLSKTSYAVTTTKWFIACGSKVFSVLLLPIFRPQGENRQQYNDFYRSAEG